MIVPFLNHTPHYTSMTTDGTNATQSLIDAIRTALKAIGWTEPGAVNTLWSPVRADCIRMTITMAVVSATQMSYVVKDHLGRLINNDTTTKQNIPVSSTMNIYYSDTYVFVEAPTGTNVWGCAVLHREPDPIADPVPAYWATYGPLRNDGTTANQLLYYNNWIGASGAGSGCDMVMWRGPSNTNDHFTSQGSMMFYPLEVGNNTWFYGRLPNCLLCDGTQWYGNTFDLALDDVTVGTFKIVRSGVYGNFVLAVRIS